MNITKKLLAVLTALVMAMSLCVPAFAAPEDKETTTAAETTKLTTTKETSDEAIAQATSDNDEDEDEDKNRPVDEIITSYNNHNGRVLSMARAGFPRMYPEDSLSGLRYCVDHGVDIISVSVQETKDKGLVLMEDETLERMLVDRSTGDPAKGKVSDFTMEELQTNFYLRDGHGGSRKATKETVPGLHDALELTRNSVMLYIRNGFEYAEIINDVAKGLNACDVVILGGATTADDIRIFVNKTGTPICHITSEFIDGTTEGAPRNYVKETLEAGADAVRLASSNDYSAIFKSATLDKFEDAGRAMISATSFAESGEHVDRIEGWQDLIEKGYSVIETDYPKELVQYIKEIESYRTELSSLITQAQTLDTENYSKETAKAMKKALDSAEKISSKGAVSLRTIDKTRYDLQESIDALETGVDVDEAHMPIWQIVLIIVIVLLAIAGFVVMLLRIFNKHKDDIRKQRKVRRKYKAMSERNLAKAETELDDSITPISQDVAGMNIYENFTGEHLERTPVEPEVPAEPEVTPETISGDFKKMLKDLEDLRKDD